MTYEASSAPQSIGGVLDDWLRLFSASFNRCWILAAIGIAAGVFAIFVATPTLPPVTASAWQHQMMTWALLNGPQNVLISLLLGLFIVVINGALFATQVRVMQGQSLGTGAALDIGLRRLLRLIAGYILQGLIGFAVMIPLVIVGIVAAVLVHSDRASFSHPLTWVVMGAVVLVSASVFIYVSVRLLLWPAAVFTENAGAATAIGRSWNLVKGHWWRVTVIMFVANIVILVLGFVVPWVLSVAFGLFSLRSLALPDAVFHLRVAQIISQTSRLLTLPLGSAVALAMFRDLTLRREGGDLASRAEALGAP